MATSYTDAEILAQVIPLIKAGESLVSISKRLNMHRRQVYRILQRNDVDPGAIRRAHADNVSTEREGNELVLNATGRVKTLTDLLREAQIDLDKWRVSKWTANKWDSMSKSGETVAMWQVKTFRYTY